MNDLNRQLHALTDKLQRFRFAIAFIIFGALAGIILWTSGQQVTRQPSEGSILDQISSAERPKLDESAAETLRKLEDQNIEVKSLFEESRNNPFVE